MENKKNDDEPLKKALEKAAEIIDFAFQNANKTISPQNEADIIAKLDAIEAQIKEFDAINQKFLEESNVGEFVLNAMMGDTKAEQITEEQRQLLLRAEELKNHAKAAAVNIQQAATAAKQEGKEILDKTQKEKSGKTRRGKFRAMGGVKNWKPL